VIKDGETKVLAADVFDRMFNFWERLYRRVGFIGVLGVDLTEIHGLGPSLALMLVGECGTDLRAWPSAKHFTSWLCLAPGNKISGGKVLSSRTLRSSSRAAALLRRRG
jgi:transposase